MEELFIKNTIQINATPAVIWDFLTNPLKTQIYMFGCEAISNWNSGDELNWRGNYEGKEIVFVTGKIVTCQKPLKLVYTTFDPNSLIEDNPSNHLTVTYELIEEGNLTILNVTQGDYNKVEDGIRRYNESYNNGEGWNPILLKIKNLAEESTM